MITNSKFDFEHWVNSEVTSWCHKHYFKWSYAIGYDIIVQDSANNIFFKGSFSDLHTVISLTY